MLSVFGSGSNTYKDSYTVQYGARKAYGQLTLAYRGRFFEAVFGLPGVIAAPIVYAYAKRELVDRGLI